MFSLIYINVKVLKMFVEIMEADSLKKNRKKDTRIELCCTHVGNVETGDIGPQLQPDCDTRTRTGTQIMRNCPEKFQFINIFYLCIVKRDNFGLLQSG